ncbi:MAG TPA: class I SAM-dependent RNA methyltransferase [Stellaceae bacterium]|nr:class I SAM-dependent RNA methyltransferase [Stellaceae bacterium]
MSGGGADTVELTVERVGARGDGIAMHGGTPVYLAFTAPGDRVRARLGRPRDEGRIGTVVDMLAPGARQAPACPHFGTCGGCALQHLTDGDYRDFKETVVRAALERRGLDAGVVEPPRRLPPGTRRRARLALSRPPKGSVRAGFHARESHEIVDMRACAVLHPTLLALVSPLRELSALLFRPGESGAAVLTRLESGVDALLELPRQPDMTMLERLAAFAETDDLARLSWCLAEEPAVPVAERRRPRIVFAGVAVDVPADGFLQASAEADAVLTELILTGIGPAKRVLDLYAGLGTFTFALAERAPVHAIDGARAAIAALSAAAARATLAGRVTAELRDLETRPVMGEELRRYDAVVFDPPRAGAKAQARALAGSHVARVVAVSCNPATFGRDARALVDGGYRLTRVVPVDQFLWSAQMELVAWFER